MTEKMLPAFKPISSPLDVDDEALARINDRLNVPALSRSSVGEAANASKAARAPLEKLTIEVPDYLGVALRRDAVEKRASVRHIVLAALQAHGYEVAEVDMVPDGRRGRAR